MDTSKILSELRAERGRIDQAIAALEAIDRAGSAPSRRGRAAGARSAAQPIRRRRRMSAAGRKRLSEMMKKRWAERRRQAKA
ncbi:MAG: hypothetical protein ACE14L_07605 [Terriglobales bacterium]